MFGLNCAFAVDRLCESIDHAADHGFPDRHFHDAAGALHLVAFTNVGVVAEQHHSNLAFFKIQREAHDAVRKFEQLAGHDFLEAIHAGNAVAHRNHAADLADFDASAIALNL